MVFIGCTEQEPSFHEARSHGLSGCIKQLSIKNKEIKRLEKILDDNNIRYTKNLDGL